MAKILNPLLFSDYFDVNPSDLDAAGLIDPFLNVDFELFIDPVLLEKSNNEEISKNAITRFREHFSNIVRLLTISKTEEDAAWKAARTLLDLKEPSENGLGYGSTSQSGSSRPYEIQTTILRTTKEVIELGANDPEMISLMGFLEEGVGPDTISDFTTKVIFPNLARITFDFCKKHNVPTKPIAETRNKIELPVFQSENKTPRHFLLVPRDIVRDLPIANE